MKNVFKFLVVLLLIGTIDPIKVNANTISTSISGVSQIESAQNVVITYNLNSSTALGGIQASVNWDARLTYVSHELLVNGTGSLNSGTGAFNMVFSSPVSGNTAFLRVTYRPSSSFTVGTTTSLSLTNVVGSDPTATTRINGSNSSKSVAYVAPKSTNNNLSALTVNGTSVPSFNANTTTYNLAATDSASITVGASVADSKATVTGIGTVNLAYGRNAVNVVVTAENGARKTYTINISRNDPRSTNNFLESITLSSGTLQFDKNRNNYTVIVDHEVEEMTITVEKEDDKASIRNATITRALEIYSNVFEFVVVAENNQQRVYTINVVRRDEDGYAGSLNTNNNLATLEVEGYDIEFDPETLEYFLNVEHPVKELFITAEIEDEKATLVTVDEYLLQLGENRFEFTVIAEDEREKQYVLTVFRALNLPPLEIEQLVERLDEVDADVLNVITTRGRRFDQTLLNQLKATNKSVAFHILDSESNSLGYWLIKSEDLDVVNTFNHGFSILSAIPESINSLLNYANAIVINFDHSGPFEKPVMFVLNTNDTFNADEVLQVYHFNEERNRLDLKHQDIIIENNEVVFTMDHASIYVVTPAIIKQGFFANFDLPFDANLAMIMGVLIALSLSLLANLLLLLKVKKLTKRIMKRQNENQLSKQEIKKQRLSSSFEATSTLEKLDKQKDELSKDTTDNQDNDKPFDPINETGKDNKE